MSFPFRLVVCLVLLTAGLGARADDPPVITAAEAVEHVGKVCCVEFVVKSTGRVKAKQGPLIFLNSEKNARVAANVAVVIDDSTAGKFAAAGIRPVEKHFLNKQVRVTGQISQYGGFSEMRIADPRQIKIVNANPPVDPAETPPPPQLQPDDFDPRPASSLPYVLVGTSLLLLVVGLVWRKLKSRSSDS